VVDVALLLSTFIRAIRNPYLYRWLRFDPANEAASAATATVAVG